MGELATCNSHGATSPMLKALVLDAFSRAGVETIQSLGRHGVAVHAAAPSDCKAFSSRYVARRWEQPKDASSSAFLGWLREMDIRQRYSLIVPSTERSLLPLLELEDYDPLRARLQLAPRRSILTALDKWSTLELAHTCGVPIPRSRLHQTGSDSSVPDSYPVVLKAMRSMIPADGGLEQSQPYLVHSLSDWKEVLHSLTPSIPLIEQERLTGFGLGVELLYQNGKMVWHFCHQRLHEGASRNGLGSGSSYRRSIPPPPILLAYATALLNRLRWNGVAMVEFLVTPEGRYYLMEINPRFWGSLALAIDAGVDFPWGLFLMATGQPVPPQPDYRVPYYTRALADDTRWILRSLRSKPHEAVLELPGVGRVLGGIESWDHFDWKDLGIITTEFRETLGHLKHSLAKRFRRKLAFRHVTRTHRKNMARLRPLLWAPRLLFICFGNTCRSPIAEQMARRRLPSWEISSAGFHPESGRSCPSHLREAAFSLGFDISHYRSKKCCSEMAEAADLIVLMDMDNFSDFERQFPDLLHKVFLLGMFLSAPREIQDLYDADFQETLGTLQLMEKSIDALAKQFEPLCDPLNVAAHHS